MSIPDAKLGLVFNYSYLWEREAKRGQEEGLKDRPAIVVGLRDLPGGDKEAFVCPITTDPPRGDDQKKDHIEIPAATKARLGMNDARSWIVTSEVNRFTWSESPDFRPVSRSQPDKMEFGIAPQGLTQQANKQVVENVLAKKLGTVERDENPKPNLFRRPTKDNPEPSPTPRKRSMDDDFMP